ncbi:phage GP46 family protein [Vibrio gazogenes]|uniref:Mu-like prophage protein gp46 n=1 Tax=Vibrio gazogenes DSM 21264 = NBRC 103151 TaxID=1123492 RepID=A0A1M5FAG5_VIBGA|nr:phage GP46 family protein [Vibrio gazogenes]USP15479.1 phage GP46 family protein [Vibrio gazogenes]SHF88600.1 Mu-like prophage protein gp46 [Vibrio gazogenes DSM 21264] [Vibrio gazogenes DSM 21264 = NBRC 103151]SJN54557.1 Phage protein GP46 [Vibrio gazogenes]
MSSILLEMAQNAGVIIEGNVTDESVAALVLISYFTDARADSSDELPDGSSDLRGWPGDTFSDQPWGSKLWLLFREKLTTDVRNRAVKYCEDALAWMLVDSGQGRMAKNVKVTGSIPAFQTLALNTVITKPDGTEMSFTVSKRWEAQRAV